MTFSDHYQHTRDDRVLAMEAYVELGGWDSLADAMNYFGKWVETGDDDEANDWLLWRAAYEVGRRKAAEEFASQFVVRAPCNWHECEAFAATRRTNHGGGIASFCRRHADEGKRLGYWRASEGCEDCKGRDSTGLTSSWECATCGRPARP